MAASSSSSSSAAKEYDVFISFRGEDTRDNFVSHLRSALSKKSIKAYIDYELNKGDEISTALIKAIQDSYGSLVVFSKNYASSRWCLNELLEILEHSKQGHFVVPVFYKIDPSHVRKQTGSYEEAFAKHEQDSRDDKNMLQKWKAALTEAANIAGWDSQSRTVRDESELIENIVKDISQKLDPICPTGESSLLGIDKYCCDIKSLLQKFLVVGIWGMGGVGKTTIAKAVFDKLSCQYDSCYFFENIREESERNRPNYLRDHLLFMLLNESFPISTHKTLELTQAAKRRLNSKKVFTVLDDVSSSKQLENLWQVCNHLGLDSKIIITTRDSGLLSSLRVKIYEVEGLNYLNSLELFKLNAFNGSYLEEGYEELSRKFVNYANGSPLALKVLGSFLVSKPIEDWESAWTKFSEIPHEDIQKVLKLSFDGLNYEERQIFLDIACFFKGESKKEIIKLLDSFGFFGKIGIKTLQDKALITISNQGKVQMHDLIQEMGWEIVHEESIEEPGRRSRLCHPKDVYDILKYNMGSDAIQGIILDMSRIKVDLYLSPNTFQKMNKLRFLKIYSPHNVESCKVYLPKNIQSFSNKIWYFLVRFLKIYAPDNVESCKVHLPMKILSFPNKIRYLHWDGCPLQSLPSGFWVEKLVELHMPYSHIERLWDGVQDLINLKRIDLHGSKQLIELPDFSKASNLESVNLSKCRSLCHIHPSILSQHALKTMDLDGCWKLESLRGEVHLKSLKHLYINECRSLKEFSLTSEKLRLLSFQRTAVQNLHSSIGGCNNLEILILSGFLKNLPNDLSKLKSLSSLHVVGCQELDTLNLQIGLDGLQCLELLQLEDCCKLSQLLGDIKHLSCLRWLIIKNCRSILYIPELPPSIETLTLKDCCELSLLPSDIKHLSCLESLTIWNCRSTLHIPELSPSIKTLDVEDCCELSQLPGDIKHLSCLRFLTIQNCRSILHIPELPPSIEELLVINCASVETIITSSRLECRKSRYFLMNCVKLDENSIVAITEHAHFRIKHATQCKVGSVRDDSYAQAILLPGNKIPSCFRYRTMQRRITIEFPPYSHLLGFAFYCIFSPEVLSDQENYFSHCACDCYLENNLIKRFESSSIFKSSCFYKEYCRALTSDHVYTWYDQFDCDRVFYEMKYRRAKGQHTKKLSFEFYVDGIYTGRKDDVIKECGVWPIYASEYDYSINDIEWSLGLKLGYRTNDIEKEQFFDATNMELECDELGPSLIGTGVATNVFDNQDLGEPELLLLPVELEVSTEIARQHLPEINSLCPLNDELDQRFEDYREFPEDALEYHSSTSQMELDLELGNDFEADGQQQPLTKKFKDLLSSLFH